SPFDAKLSVGSPRKDSLAPLLILTGLRLAGDWTPARWLGRLPSTGLRTAWLEKTTGTLSLVSKGGLVGDGLTMYAKLSDGLLYVDKLEASPWQGTLQAEVTLERRRNQPFVAVAIELDQIEAAKLAAWLGVKSGISGSLDLRLEASSIGTTPYEMMAGLAGEMTIKAGPGEIKGVGVTALREALMPDVENGGPVARSLTLPFTSIEATTGLSRGILTVEDGRLSILSESGGEAVSSIDGTVDLLLWIADLILTTSPDQADGEAAGTYRVIGPPDRPVGTIPFGN
ncbi:MAG: AsmA-like C-terminal region-containing protein, partial [Pseudomonadota bacterium]